MGGTYGRNRVPKTIAPIFKTEGRYWIDTTELLGEGAEYGPYHTKLEAEEDRGPVVDRIKARRKLGITKFEPAFAITANELKLAVKLLGKSTKGSMRCSRLSPDQRKPIALLLYKWKGTLGEETLASLDTLKELLYREAGIDPGWPDADEAFAQWAINFAKD